MNDGLTVVRTKTHKHGKGKLKQISFADTFTPPKSGWMFPSRAKAQAGHVCYHAVYSQIKRCAPLFLKHLQRQGRTHSPEVAKLRPHSGLLLVWF